MLFPSLRPARLPLATLFPPGAVAALLLIAASPPVTIPLAADPADPGDPPGLWSSALHGLVEVRLEKRWGEPFDDPETALRRPPEEVYTPLPPEVRGLLGPHAVEYDAFTVTRLPKPAADRLVSTAAARQLGFQVRETSPVRLAWHGFDPADPAARVPAGTAVHVDPAPVPGLYLARFAYPVRRPWVEQLITCGAEEIAYFGSGVFLFRAAHGGVLTDCPAAGYLAWVDAYLNTDRVAPSLLAATGTRSYELQYLPGTDLEARAAAWSGIARIDEIRPPPRGAAGHLRVTASPQALRQIVATDPELLSVSRAGEAVLSDEQQGQIVAGNYDSWGVPYGGYYGWLANRGLLSSSNPQVVAVIDTGFDDGNLAESEHHPDLQHPVAGQVRLTGIDSYGRSYTHDPDGHGTMVAGIIAGYGPATGARDGSNLHYGSGVAPHTRLFIAAMGSFRYTSYLQQALDDAIQTVPPATIVNSSWNLLGGDPSLPLNGYESMARQFDAWVFDATPDTTAWDPISMSVAAGNFTDTCNGLWWDTVASPATAKNVIAVGATSSYRPAPDPELYCRSCQVQQGEGRPKENDATSIHDVASFSSRGFFFGPAPSSQVAYDTRIKPDLVAPGNRVFSTVPHKTAGSTIYTNYENKVFNNGCTKYEPPATDPNFAYHTYGTGTSFAAPVVSGVAALARKWMLDRGAGSVSPSLVKAALIATADDLGGLGNNGGDHRPSPRYGWGRVNLERLTDGKPKFLHTDGLSSALMTGETVQFQRTIGNGNVDTYVTLAWTDRPTAVDGDSQVALVNDLSLKVDGGVYRGNAFNEALSGVDDGYSFPFTVCACPQDRVNTVESVFIPAGTFSSGQSITITVTGENVPQPIGRYGQMFALYAYNVQ